MFECEEKLTDKSKFGYKTESVQKIRKPLYRHSATLETLIPRVKHHKQLTPETSSDEAVVLQQDSHVPNSFKNITIDDQLIIPPDNIHKLNENSTNTTDILRVSIGVNTYRNEYSNEYSSLHRSELVTIGTNTISNNKTDLTLCYTIAADDGDPNNNKQQPIKNSYHKNRFVCFVTWTFEQMTVNRLKVILILSILFVMTCVTFYTIHKSKRHFRCAVETDEEEDLVKRDEFGLMRQESDNIEEASTTNSAVKMDPTSFSCEGRPSGYYADIETGCQVYHMCDGLGRQFSYSCPNTTLFQQRMLICDHWYMVNCSQSETDYSANLLIGQRDKPFVDDNTVHKRTPRPDLLTQPFGAPQYDQVRGRQYNKLNQERNLIGGDILPPTKRNNDTNKRSDVKYFVPSHWSTELYQQTITENPRRLLQKLQHDSKDNLKTTTSTPRSSQTIEAPSKYFQPPYDTRRYQVQRNQNSQDLNKILEQTALTLQSLKVNLTSTTFKTIDEQMTVVEDSSTESSQKINNEQKYNFNSSVSKEFPVQINTGVKFTERVDIDPPSKELQPPKFDQTISSKIVPEKDLPPKYETDDLKTNQSNSIYDEGKIRDLRKAYFIPEFNFPLDPLPRPNYNSISSYQVQATGEINDTKTVPTKPDCPERCDPSMLISGTCQPCILVKR